MQIYLKRLMDVNLSMFFFCFYCYFIILVRFNLLLAVASFILIVSTIFFLHLINIKTTLTFADSTLNAPIFDESHGGVQTNSQLPTSNHTDGTENGVMVDDMFLTLDSSFTDDFEKIKRIASDVQQFCIASDDFSEIITEVAIQPQNSTSIVTTTLPQQDIVTR